MTNFEKIKKIEDENELISYLIKNSSCESCEFYTESNSCSISQDFACFRTYAPHLVLDWLRSESRN